MRSDECSTIRRDLGAYLLGALDGADRTRVTAHVAKCPDCREELAGLAPLPGLLAQISGDDVEVDDDAVPGPCGSEKWLAEIARIRRRRRVVAGVVVACAAVAIGMFGVRQALQGPDPSRGIVISASNPSSHVSGQATLLSTPEGTTVKVAVSGVRPGTRCELIVLGSGGGRDIAATWRANYEGVATVIGASALKPAQIQDVIVSARAAAPLLVISRPPTAVRAT